MIPFNRPTVLGCEIQLITDALGNLKLCGDGPYAKQCETKLNEQIGCASSLLTPSCTHALELAALVCNIVPGDEVILPSFTFVSTASAFALRGAKLVFVDIDPRTMNIDEKLIERAISKRTKAIVPVHYAGVACEMDTILDLGKRHALWIIEDAAQCIGSTYRYQSLGSFGQLSAFSFHETKNLTSGGEGGCLCINDASLISKAETCREKGTNRKQFYRGEVDKYTWVEIGSSYLPSELQAAFLLSQLNCVQSVTKDRLDTWNIYFNGLSDLKRRERIELPHIPNHCQHNAHIFYIKTRDGEERGELLQYLKSLGISATFHYVPLHSSPMGRVYGAFAGDDRYTTVESERLLRLPLYYGINRSDVHFVIESIYAFYANK